MEVSANKKKGLFKKISDFILDIVRWEAERFVGDSCAAFLTALAIIPIFSINAIRNGNHGFPVIIMVIWAVIIPIVLLFLHRWKVVRYKISIPCLIVILGAAFTVKLG